MRKKSVFVLLGVVAVLVAVVLVAGQAGGGPDERPGVSERPSDVSLLLSSRLPGEADVAVPPEEEPAANDEAYASDGGIGDEDVTPPLPDVAGRKLVQDAGIRLEVERVTDAVRRVEAIASEAGGFVSASNVFVEQRPETPDDEPRPPEPTQSASITIRVPADAYAAVMAKLGELGEMKSQSSTTSDVTEEFTDLEARLRNLEATEGRYLELLQTAKTIPDILTIQDRINSVRLEIERIQGRMNLLNDLSDMATIVVELGPVGAEAPSQPGWAEETWDNAWERSQDAMEAMGTVAIVGGVVLAWLAVPALAIAIGWRLLRPRRARGGEA